MAAGGANEAHKIKHRIVTYTRGVGLDLGCGPGKAWPHFTGLDAMPFFPTTEERPDVIRDARDLSIFSRASLDYVFSSFLLHKFQNAEEVLREWWRPLKQHGHLVLYLPLPDSPPLVSPDGEIEGWAKRSAKDYIEIMRKIGGWDLVVNETRTRWGEYAMFQVYRKEPGGKRTFSHETRKTDKPKALVIRYGAIGDLIQASSILPLLKEQGFHVTFNCHPNGPEILGNNPYIDEFLPQDPNQVPNDSRLGEYWGNLGREYDKVVNFSESTEGTLLGIPGRHTHAISHVARGLLMDVNYLEFMHAIAELPFVPKPMFFPTDAEKLEMKDLRAKLGSDPVILWSLAGSSVHKAWPWVGETVGWLLEKTPFKILLVGGAECQILEAGVVQMLLKRFLGIADEESHAAKLSDNLLKLKVHFGQNRVICRSGLWSVRQSLTFNFYADLVVGPETGVLNAASMLDVPKVVLLSHSSAKNLTRDWVNTTALTPPDLPCYPCHRLHYSTQFCNIDGKTHAAKCASLITPPMMFDAIMRQLGYAPTSQIKAAE